MARFLVGLSPVAVPSGRARAIPRLPKFILAIGFLCVASLAQQPKVLAPHRPVAPKAAKPLPLPPAVPGSIVGGPWMVDANFKSSLYLKNSVETSSVTVTPKLFLSNGTKYRLPEVQLEPSGTAIVDINAALQSLGIAPYATLSGYVEVDYSWPWDPICATIRNLDIVHSLIFNYGLRSTKPFQLPSQPPLAPGPQTNIVEGMWWKQEPNVTGFVTLANTSSQPVTAQMQVSDSLGASFAQHAVTISPHGMKQISLNELASAATADGGIRITYTGNTSDLLINGGLEDQGSGYSAILSFTPAPASTQASTASVAELGLMTGPADPMMQFPAGTTFTPYTVLRNVSTAALTATPTVWWMAAGTAKSAQLPAISLASYQSRTLNVPALLAAAGLQSSSGNVNLVFEVQGNTGGLLMAGGSVDQTNTYVFEITPHGISESASKSLSYWSTANGDDTMVTLWNPADEAQDFIFRLTFTGGHYGLPVHLDPRATRTFNISEIIQNQIPDAEGNIIPVTVHEGAANLAGSVADNQHILVAMDAGTYNVQKATCVIYCQGCDGVTGHSMAPSSFSLALGQQIQLTFYENWSNGAQYTSGGPWQSSNNNLATVQNGLVTAVGAGSPTITATDTSSLQPVYVYQWCEGTPWSCPYSYQTGGSASSAGTIGDPTPVISSISPSTWPAGTTNLLVTITGTGFGTNPLVSLSDAAINWQLYSATDNGASGGATVKGYVTVPLCSITEAINVNVKSQGYNGSGFIPTTPGQSPLSPNFGASVQAIATAAISLSRVSLTQIQATGSPNSGGSFSYGVASLNGTSLAGINYASGVTSTSNPNVANLTDPTNPNSNGSPSPGGLAQIAAKYSTCTSASDSFHIPTFGMSCYYTTLQSDWGTSPNNCTTITINGVRYSGTVTNPNGLTGTYCSAFIAELKIQGSAVLNSGTDIQYNSITRLIVTVAHIVGADGTAVVAHQTVARDKSPISGCSTTHYGIIPATGVHVDIDKIGTGLLANDAGCAIAGYRFDLYNGSGKAVCANFNNIISVSACTPGNTSCPVRTIH